MAPVLPPPIMDHRKQRKYWLYPDTGYPPEVIEPTPKWMAYMGVTSFVVMLIVAVWTLLGALYFHYHLDHTTWMIVFLVLGVMALAGGAIFTSWFHEATKIKSSDSRSKTTPFWVRRIHLKLINYRIVNNLEKQQIELHIKVGPLGMWRFIDEWSITSSGEERATNQAKSTMESRIKADWEYTHVRYKYVLGTYNAKQYFSEIKQKVL